MHSALQTTIKSRERLVNHIDTLTTDQLNYIPPNFNNNIIWNITHVVAVQQALVYGLSGLPYTIEKDLVRHFGKGTKPEQDMLPKDILKIKTYLLSTIENTQRDLDKGLFKTYNAYTVTLGITLSTAEDAIVFNNYHEGLHLGSIMALRKLV